MSKKKNISLSDIPKEADFPIPEGYFETLPERIRQRIALEEEQKFVVRKGRIRKNKNILRVLSLAAALALFLTMGRLFLVPEGERSFDERIAALSDADIVAYLEAENVSLEAVADMPEVLRSVDELSSEFVHLKNEAEIERYLEEEGF